MDCKYCSKTFRDKAKLNRHQTTSKSCIVLQNGEVKLKLFECEFCKKQLTSKHNFIYHNNVCKIKKYSEVLQHETIQATLSKQKKRIEWELERHKKDMEEDVELKIQELSSTIRQQHEYESRQQAEQVRELQEELKRLKQNSVSATNHLENVSQTQYTNSFNKTYNISITNYLTEERVTKAFESYTIDTLLGSQKELANFTIDHFLVGENTPVYLCTDRSRKKFFFTDTKGKLMEDANCTTLVNYIMKHGFSKIRDVCMEALENTPVGITEEIIHKKYDSLCAIGKDGGEYQSQLGKRLPSSITDKKRLDELQDDPSSVSIPSLPNPEVTTVTDEQEKVIVDHEVYMMYKTIGGIPLYRLNKYRLNYRITGDTTVPSIIEQCTPEVDAQYQKFIQSADMEHVL